LTNEEIADMKCCHRHNATKEFVNLRGRYLKIIAQNIGVCPEWHPGAGGKAWVFVDEIV